MVNLQRIEYDNNEKNLTGTENVVIWLENGGKIRYKRTEDGAIKQQTFKPNDPHTVWESTEVGTEDDSVREFAMDWIEWYSNADEEEIKSDDFSGCVLANSTVYKS
jgi:hypothetical protein